MWYAISIVAGAVALIILGCWGSFVLGKRVGDTNARIDTAEARNRDMAKAAELAARPPVDKPFGMLHK